ncbi:MAG: hypothetical protein JKY43_07145 [Phycisphaerales bacterium]|nr:hypothetical protein [Phycisphaerales bacterium]
MRTKSTYLMNLNSKLNSKLSSKLSIILTLGLLNLALVSPAFGQTTVLPPSIVEAAAVNGTQQSQIASFVDHWGQRAIGTDSQQASRAMTKLLEPMINARVSISFRRAYSDALGSLLDALQANGDIGSTLSALRLAGELGSTRGTQIILSGLDNSDVGIRIFAAGRAGRTFRTTAANGPAMSANDLNSLIAKLDSIANSTDNQSLMSASIQALGYGCSLPSDDFLATRADCIRIMSNVAGAQLSTGSSDLDSRVRIAMLASGAATHSLSQVGEDSTNEAVRSAVGLGASMISIALSEVIAGTMPGVDDRALYVTLVRSGESLLYFALREYAELNGRSASGVDQTAFADLLEAGDDRSFRNKAALLLGPGSPIVTDFGFADDEFVR